MANWNLLHSIEDVHTVDQVSHELPCIIYKHSTRCSISSVAENRLRKGLHFSASEAEVYYLDLIAYRQVSDFIAEHYGVQHESPQVLIIQEGRCVYHSSHLAISPSEITEIISQTSRETS